MSSPCLKCKSRNTELFIGDSGHMEKECHDCGHVGGPYVSSVIQEDNNEEAKGITDL